MKESLEQDYYYYFVCPFKSEIDKTDTELIIFLYKLNLSFKMFNLNKIKIV